MKSGCAEVFFGSIRQTAGCAGKAVKKSSSRAGSNSSSESRLSTNSGYYAGEISRTQRPGGDYQALDFAGAFVDFSDARVAVIAFHRIFAAVAVAAMNLYRFMRDSRSHFAGEKFGHGSIHAEACSGILLPGGFANQQACGVDLRGHVRQHELNRLKFGDGMAEGESFFGIPQCRFESAFRDACSLRGNSDTATI